MKRDITISLDAKGQPLYKDEKGFLHREDGPAYIYKGTTKWYKHGKLHRIGGPAIEWSNGGKEWWVDGELHNENGPAYIDGWVYPSIGKYYLFGKEYSKEEWTIAVRKLKLDKLLTN